MNNLKIATMYPRLILIVFLIIAIFSCKESKRNKVKDLSGDWAFEMDSADKGIEEKWFTKSLSEKIHLPGSMTENLKGFEVDSNIQWTGQIMDSSWHKSEKYKKYRQPGNVKIPFWLQPAKYYKGAAWYQKVVDVPNDWDGQAFVLFLERCHISTRLWINGIEIGTRNSLSAPHIYELNDAIKPGKNTITICVDNRMTTVNVGSNSHSVTDHTQTNWNGIVGKMELRVLPLVHISNVSLVSNIHSKNINIKIHLKNKTKGSTKGSFKIRAISDDGKNAAFKTIEQDVAFDGAEKVFEITYPMGEDAKLWDEFDPHLYRMQISYESDDKKTDSKEILFGLRQFETKGTNFTVNNRLTYLRGTVDCAIFPLTGYVPTDTASWTRIYRIAKAHGLNHFRFHSYCPPDAAFEAADRLGFYLQVEASSWANFDVKIGDGTPLDSFIYEESHRIVEAYANHPSFCLMMYGNEPSGNNHVKWLTDYVHYWQKKDTRFLVSTGAGWPVIEGPDFASNPAGRIQCWDGNFLNKKPASTLYDWTKHVNYSKSPTLSHEIGQWCVYPDLKEVSQYTGILKAKNFEIFAESLKESNLFHLADSFLLASGKLQALCYKAEVEASLRTPNQGGFQLLGLQDFPGQGTALVGVLNPFWREKGYISAKEFKSFCNSTVLLARLPKMIYMSDEIFTASIEVAHYGKSPLKSVTPSWKLINQKGKEVAAGKLPNSNIQLGNVIRLGEIETPLNGLNVPQMLTLVISINDFKNQWDIWVYPAKKDLTEQSILVTDRIDNRILSELENGGSVLLSIRKGSLHPDMGGKIGVNFTPIFWNTAWFRNSPPHTLGILCDPRHRALAEFPTQFHSNYQWQDLMENSSALMLSKIAPDAKPIVRIIDDWFTNRSLALILEAKVGKGKIIICGVDLITNAANRPEARQLRNSLTSYMSSPQFNPTVQIDRRTLSSLIIKK